MNHKKELPTYSLHCSSFLGFPFGILNIELVKPKKGTTMETTGRSLWVRPINIPKRLLSASAFALLILGMIVFGLPRGRVWLLWGFLVGAQGSKCGASGLFLSFLGAG